MPRLHRREGFTPIETIGQSQDKKMSLAGFTLVELVMTIMVVGIVSIPLSLLLSQHIQSVFQSEDYTLALNFARFEMEKVNNLAYGNIIDNSSNYGNYNVSRIVSYARGSRNSSESLKKIVVEVSKSGSATVLVSLVTYIARNVVYGI